MKIALTPGVHFKITPFSGLLVDLNTLKATRLSSRAAEALEALLNGNACLEQKGDNYQTKLLRTLERSGLVRFL